VSLIVVAILIMATALVAVTAYMEWVGVRDLLEWDSRQTRRYPGCGHLARVPTSAHTRCSRCRHARLVRMLHTPVHQHP
jgi:hypothetical protein